MSLEAEWSNTYDKLRAMMQRIAKRAEVAEKAVSAGAPDAAAPSPQGVGGRLLTARQLQIQQQILRRRANGGEQ